MRKPIRITVKGTDSRGDDAPTVEDLLTQIQDFVSVLQSVEDAISIDNKENIVWCVTNASKNSPLTIELTPYPKIHAMNIDNKAAEVVTATAIGLNALSRTGMRPMYFDDKAMARAEKVYSRVTNGLASTLIDFSRYTDAPNLEVTPPIAREAINKIQEIAKPKNTAHRELGSLEGFINKVELDGYGRPIVWLKSRLDGQSVKCISSTKGLNRIGHFEVHEVLEGMRVRVHGLLHYKDLNQINTIDVDAVHVFEKDENLPSMDSIVDPNFTSGVEACAYLRAIRENE